jgi:ethanolamine ammonia-lyase small subunit
MNPTQPQSTPKPDAVSGADAPLSASPSSADLRIDLPEPVKKSGVSHPKDADGLRALIAATPARIGVGRAGPRYTTAELLRFQGDHAITQDALYDEVDQDLLDEFNLFSVQTKITGGRQQYLLRPDLGRQLNEEARELILEQCQKHANLQLVIGDGLSAAAIEANLHQMLPLLRQGAQAAGLTFGTPFFVNHARVGIMNDIGELLMPDVLVLLIGERPGLGRADSMSAYMAYRPKPGDTDADRNVICNIFAHGGTQPHEASELILALAQKMRKNQKSGVKLA